MAKPILTADRVRELFHYDPNTGIFTRLQSRTKNNIGQEVGSQHSKGYVCTKIDGRQYFMHRLAWIYMTGSWPDGQIDHINGIRNDNRFRNLRDVSQSQNMLNQSRPQRRNKTGYLGVSYSPATKKKYRAQLTVNGTHQDVGYFATAKEAGAAYAEAKRRMLSAHT